ncbi:unnamed protein product [Owenia fusiformis]|uniref:FYVE-type domain-containing protein n=1 Tax=Owenia fusiformis TaxID=6347 RepID=A0A8S4NNQ3_OWEFU|nr:unnamed protein product [Owenia fusiformis]
MYSIRRWLYKPKKTDSSLLAQFFYADEELNLIAAELDSFDGRKDPERCTLLVNSLRCCQDRVLNLMMKFMDEVIPDKRANRDFRVKFPDDVLQESLAGQLWFGAECLAAGSNIVNREVESASMRPLAKALTRHLDNLRSLMREQCLKNINVYDENIKHGLEVFDRLFAEFELSYVSAMVPVKSMKEYDILQDVIILFSESIMRALKLELLTQDMLDDYDPALMFTIPRLAIVCGLLVFPEGPLNPDLVPQHMSEMFRPFQTLLFKIRELLWTLNRDEMWTLEKSLCSAEEPGLYREIEPVRFPRNSQSDYMYIPPPKDRKDKPTNEISVTMATQTDESGSIENISDELGMTENMNDSEDISVQITRFKRDSSSETITADAREFSTSNRASFSLQGDLATPINSPDQERRKTIVMEDQIPTNDKSGFMESDDDIDSEKPVPISGELREACQDVVLSLFEMAYIEASFEQERENERQLLNAVHAYKNSSSEACVEDDKGATEDDIIVVEHDISEIENDKIALECENDIISPENDSIAAVNDNDIIDNADIEAVQIAAEHEDNVLRSCDKTIDADSNVSKDDDIEGPVEKNMNKQFDEESIEILKDPITADDCTVLSVNPSATNSIVVPSDNASDNQLNQNLTLPSMQSITNGVNHDNSNHDEDEVNANDKRQDMGASGEAKQHDESVKLTDDKNSQGSGSESPVKEHFNIRSLIKEMTNIRELALNEIAQPGNDEPHTSQHDTASDAKKHPSQSGPLDSRSDTNAEVMSENDDSDIVILEENANGVTNEKSKKRGSSKNVSKSSKNKSNSKKNSVKKSKNRKEAKSNEPISPIRNRADCKGAPVVGHTNLRAGTAQQASTSSAQTVENDNVFMDRSDINPDHRSRSLGTPVSNNPTLLAVARGASASPHLSSNNRTTSQNGTSHSKRRNKRGRKRHGQSSHYANTNPERLNRRCDTTCDGCYGEKTQGECPKKMAVDWDRESYNSSDTSSYNSESADDEEIQLAVQAAELASRKEARARFRSSGDLIHRLFVCISGVADQLQTNYASDLRHILKIVFEMHCTESLLPVDAAEEATLCESILSDEGATNEEVQASRRTVEEPPPWLPDETCPHCTACKIPFNFVKRRHHCRNCGKIFCSRCSSNQVSLPQYGHSKPVRVCNRCYMFQVTPFSVTPESSASSVQG